MTDDPRGAQLASLIDEDPEDATAFRALGDWLEERGDVRAKLMTMQDIRERLTDRTKLDHLEARLSELFEANREHFLGKLAKVMPKPTASREARANAPVLVWRHGYVYKAELKRVARLRMHQFLEHLLAHESGRFVVDLDVVWPEDAAATVAALAAAPLSLRKLRVGIADADLSSLWPKLPRLRELRVESARVLGAMDLPELRAVHVHVPRADQLYAVGTASWPKLERLSVFVPQDARAEQAVALVERADLPALHTLRFDSHAQLEALVDAFVASPLAAQVRTLELPSAGDAIIAALRRMPRVLERVVLPPYATTAEVADVAREVVAERV